MAQCPSFSTSLWDYYFIF